MPWFPKRQKYHKGERVAGSNETWEGAFTFSKLREPATLPANVGDSHLPQERLLTTEERFVELTVGFVKDLLGMRYLAISSPRKNS